MFGWKNCVAHVGLGALVHHLRENHTIRETDETKFSLNLITPSSVLEAQSTTHHQGGGIVWNPLLISSAFDSDILLKYYISPGGYLNLAGYLLGGVDVDDDDGEWKKFRMKLEINSASKVNPITLFDTFTHENILVTLFYRWHAWNGQDV